MKVSATKVLGFEMTLNLPVASLH